MNLTSWDRIVSQSTSDLDIDIISPFGFEVLGNVNFLKNELRRFYLYYKGNYDENYILDRIVSLVKKEHSSFFKDIAVVGSRKYGFKVVVNREPTIDDVFISIQKINTDKSILESYACYLSCSFYSVSTNTLPELSRSQDNAMARLRVRQLYKIYQELYKDYDVKAIDGLKFSPTEITFMVRPEEPVNNEIFQIDEIVSNCKVLHEKVNKNNPQYFKYNHFGADDSELAFLDKLVVKEAMNKVENTYMLLHKDHG